MFGAIEDVLVTLFHRARAHRDDVAPRARFGYAEGGVPAIFGNRGNKFAFLFFRRGKVQGSQGKFVGVGGCGYTRARRRQFLAHNGRFEPTLPTSPICFFDGEV